MRQKPLTRAEIETCDRLVKFRRMTMLSRVALAKLLQTDSSRIANTELRRVPLQPDVIRWLNVMFLLRESWLTEGKGQPFESKAPILRWWNLEALK